MNRKKRLEKGIESIEAQINIHERKLKDAEESGEEELAEYYVKDLARLKKQKDQKKEKFLKE